MPRATKKWNRLVSFSDRESLDEFLVVKGNMYVTGRYIKVGLRQNFVLGFGVFWGVFDILGFVLGFGFFGPQKPKKNSAFLLHRAGILAF